MVVHTLQVTGTRGEITPLMHARIDTDFYQAGYAQARNMVVTRYGAMTRAPGTIYEGKTKTAGAPVRMLPFEFNEEQVYAIEAGDGYFRFWTPEGQVFDDGVPYEIATPFDTDDLPFLHGRQVADAFYLFSGGRKQVQILKRMGETNWTLEPYKTKDGPYLPINETATTLTPSDYGDLTPKMTSNTAPRGTLTSSPSYSDAWRAFNKSKQNGAIWQKTQTGWVQYQDTAPAIIDAYYFTSTSEEHPGDTPVAWTVEGSNDGVEWVTLDSRQGETGWRSGETRFYEFSNKTAFLYHRLVWLSNDSGEWTRIYELGFHRAAENQTPFNLTASSTDGINDGDGFVAEDIGRSIRLQASDGRWRWAEITEVVSSTVVKVRLYGHALPDLKAILNWRLGAWSERSGWPYTGRVFEDRLTLAGADDDPIGLWMSVNGAYDDFRTSVPPVDDDSLTLRLTGGKLNAIQWLAESGTLLAGTADILRSVGGRDQGAALSPTNVRQRAETAVGAARIEPVEVENSVLFVHRSKRRLYEAAYSFEADGYLAREVSTLNEHLFRVGIEQIVFFDEPFKYCLCRRTDGKIIFFAYDKEQKIVGGTLVDYGAVRDIMAMPGRDGVDVWLVADRGEDTVIERFAPFPAAGGLVDGTLNVPVHSYCSTVYDVGAGNETDTFAVPDCLEGETLGVWADGRDIGDAVVTDGKIVLPYGKKAARVVLGKRMPWRLQTLRLATYGQQDGAGLGRKMRIVEAFVDLLDSAGVEGGTLAETQPITDEASADYDPDDPEPLLTGMYPVYVDDSWQNQGVFVMRGDKMTPVTIRGFSLAVEGEP